MIINWFSITLIISAVITGFLALSSWQKGKTHGVRYFSCLLFALTEWALANAFEYMTPNIETKIILTKIAYLGLSSMPAFLFSFIFTFVGLKEKYGKIALKCIWIIPVVILALAITNDYHFLMWSAYIPTESSIGINIFYRTGPFVWIFMGFCYLILLYSVYCVLKFFPQEHVKYKWQSKLFILALIFPWIGNILYLSRWSPIPELDITPLTFSLLGITLFVATSRFSLFDVAPQAKEFLFRLMHDPVIVLDDKLKVIDFNPVARDQFNLIIGQFIYDIIPEIRREISGSINAPLTFELKKLVDNQFVWHEGSVSLMQNQFGTLEGYLLVLRNITRRKKAERDSLKSEATLKELNASKDKFFSIMAHDIRNPLSALKNGLEVASDLYYTFEEQERFDFLYNLKASAVQLTNLTENLLTWSRSQTGHIVYSPIEFDLAFIAKGNVSLFQHTAQAKNISIISEVEDLTPCYGDINMINTVLRNLCSNAIKFTPENGVVKICANLSGDEKEVKISVSDTGLGMDKKMVAKLFKIDENVTTTGTANERGTGLGLILCNEFIRKHGSMITIESELGKGSCFTFKLKTRNS